MQYIEDLYPPSRIYRDKLRKYLHFRNERAEFEKSLNEMRYCDWVIHKKLSEERGQRACFYAARGNGKWSLIDRYLNLLTEGKDVINAFEKPKQVTKKEPVLDYDIYNTNSPLAEAFEKYIREQCRTKTKKPVRDILSPLNPCYGHYIWEPKIRTDAYAYPNDYAKQFWLYNQMLFGGVSKDMLDEGHDYFVVKKDI